MRRRIWWSMVGVAALVLTGLVGSPGARAQAVTGTSAGVTDRVAAQRAPAALLRLYNQTVGDHFYTTDMAEAIRATNLGYRYEGNCCTVNPDDGVPLLRLYHPGTGDHFYTTDAAEASYAQTVGYRSEGTCCTVGPASGPGDPLYRLYSPSTGDHFYTTSFVEVNNAIALYHYLFEGTCCRVNI